MPENYGKPENYSGGEIHGWYSDADHSVITAAVAQYSLVTTYKGTHYAPLPVTNVETGITYYLPAIHLIDFSGPAVDVYEKGYAQLVSAIQSGDITDDANAFNYVLKMQTAAQNGQALYYLDGNAASQGAGGATYSNAKDSTPDNELEIVVRYNELSKGLAEGDDTSIIKFLDRMFHEPTHMDFLHEDIQSKIVVGGISLTPITMADILSDDGYMMTESVMKMIANGFGGGVTVSDVQRFYEENDDSIGDKYSSRELLVFVYDNLRVNENYKYLQTLMAASGTAPIYTLDQATILGLVAQDYLELKSMPSGLTTEQQIEFKRDLRNYNLKSKPINKYASLGELDKFLASGVFAAAVSATDKPNAFAEIFHSMLLEAREFFSMYSSEIGGIIGSTLGRALFEDQGEGIVASVVLSAVGREVGQTLENVLNGQTLESAAKDAFSELPSDIVSAGVGAISSYLAAELINAFGLEGVAAEVGSSLTGAAIGRIADNLLNLGDPIYNALGQQTGTVQWNTGVGGALAGAAASFIGVYLARQLIEFDTIGGQIGASLGSAIGGFLGGQILGAQGSFLAAQFGILGGPIGIAIGAFLGYILGGLIGSLFGGEPKSRADIGWKDKQSDFSVVRTWSKNNGSEEGAKSLATVVADTLNGIIIATGSGVLDPGKVNVGSYGIWGKDYAYWPTFGPGQGTITYRTKDARALISYGAYKAVETLAPQLLGGNVYVKRALLSTLSADVGDLDLGMLSANMSVARDYSFYKANNTQIGALIAVAPESTFAMGWLLTLAQAQDLGLDKRAFTDWIGGWATFLDETLDGQRNGLAFSPANLTFRLEGNLERVFVFVRSDGYSIGEMRDTIDSLSKDKINGSSSANTITFNGDTLSSTTGLTINGAAPTASTYKVKIAAVIDAGAGNDTVRAGDLGNDVLGGDGADKLVGGKLDDWLFGQGGDDVLFAGNVSNIGFAVTDTAARNTALAVDGGNGDLLDGGDGDDRLYGGKGSEWLKGGAGIDWLYGGAGGDILEGGAGDDKGTDGSARLLGGSGTDQYVFGYGDGKDVIFDEADVSGVAGSTGDSYASRVASIGQGATSADWAGNGTYLADGSVKGGEDAIAFGPGISMRNLIMKRSGTTSAPGQDLIILLTAADANGAQQLTGDEIVVKDWFESTRRVEWLRFADGTDIRIGDMTTYIIGTAAADVIVGTQGADFLYGSDGNDTIRGLGGGDFGNGGRGHDFVAGDDDNDWVLGESGNDRVLGGAGHDTVFGDDGDDYAYGGAGNDLIVGGRGDDELIGGVGADIFRYQRGDGRDVIIDDFSANWEIVWQNGAYVNGYQQDATTGVVSQYGVTYFDGTGWIGRYDWDNNGQTMRRHKGPLNGRIASNDFYSDQLEFGAGVNIQDLAIEKIGGDLVIAVVGENYDGVAMDADDRIIIKEWTPALPTVTSMVFLATGSHSFMNAVVGTSTADVLNAGSQSNAWVSGGAGNDQLTALTGTLNLAFGGAGDDTILAVGIAWGGAGNDAITLNNTDGKAWGGDGDDVISGPGTLYGDGGDDIISGAATAYGGAGDDTLKSGAGANVLDGGEGADTADYSAMDQASNGAGVQAYLTNAALNTAWAAGDTYVGIENLGGSNFADRLAGDANANELHGGAGDDVLMGGLGDDVYVWKTGGGSDVIKDHAFSTEQCVDASGNLMTGYTATATYLGTMQVNGATYVKYRCTATNNATGEIVYQSRDGVDFIYPIGYAPTQIPPASSWPYANGQWKNGFGRTSASPVVSRISEGAGEAGADTLFIEGAGLAHLTFSWVNGSADLQIGINNNGSTGQLMLVGQNNSQRAIETIEFADGGSFALSTLRLPGAAGTAGVDTMVGTAGVDSLSGGGDADWLVGGAGADTLNGGDGDDLLEGGADGDVFIGGADRVSSNVALDPNDPTAYGDTITYANSTAAVTVNLTTGAASGGHAAGDTFMASGVSTVENVVGSALNDSLTGDGRANRLIGGGGNDTLVGNAGDDVLVAGSSARSSLSGGDGNDNLFGGHSLAGGNGDDVLFTTFAGDATLAGATLSGNAGADRITAGEGADTLNGDAGDDVLGGGEGADTLSGGSENDSLAGEGGADTLNGDLGNDTLVGGAGNDILNGGAGDDVYAFDANSGTDHIVGNQGVDVIQISGVQPQELWLTREGNNLKVSVTGGDTVIYLDNYYVAGGATVKRIETAGATLFLDYASPLVEAMTASAPTSPPQSVLDLIGLYWHEGGKAAPIVADQQLAAVVNVGLSGAAGAVDHDQNITAYAVVDGPDRGTLSLNTATGAFVYTANSTGADSFIISVMDADNHVVEQKVDVQVGTAPPAGVNPPVISSQPLSIVQSMTSSGQVVANFAAPPAGQSIVLHANPNNWFTLSGNQLKLGTGINMNFETMIATAAPSSVTDVDADGQKEVTLAAAVKTSNGAGGFSTPTTVYFRVEDHNEAPWVNNATFSIAENAPANTLIGAPQWGDPDSQTYNRNVVFSLDAASDQVFDIDPVTGQIYIANSPNYETANTYSLNVTLKDAVNAQLVDTASVTVNVTNVNEAPIISAFTFSMWDHWSISYTDPDGVWQNNVSGFTVQQVYDLPTGFAAAFDPSQPHGFGITQNGLLRVTIGFYANPSSTYGTVQIQRYASYTGNPPDFVAKLLITDTGGNQSTQYVRMQMGSLQVVAPIVLDLDGDGVELVKRKNSEIWFDVDGDGGLDNTGWVKADDGLLALDRNGDGQITTGAEISFTADDPYAVSDLEGLRAYDSNQNGFLDEGDARFGEFRVWQDLNQDGVSQAGELKTLSGQGVSAISLTLTPTGAKKKDATENAVYGTTTFVRTGGGVGEAADVILSYHDTSVTMEVLEDPSAYIGRDAAPPAAVADNPGGPGGVDRSASGHVPQAYRRMALESAQTASSPEAEPIEAPAIQAAAADQGPAGSAAPEPVLQSWNWPQATLADREGFVYQAAWRASALDARLNLASRETLMMVEAMASFAPRYGTALSLNGLPSLDPAVQALLTSLPDLRAA